MSGKRFGGKRLPPTNYGGKRFPQFASKRMRLDADEDHDEVEEAEETNVIPVRNEPTRAWVGKMEAMRRRHMGEDDEDEQEEEEDEPLEEEEEEIDVGGWGGSGKLAALRRRQLQLKPEEESGRYLGGGKLAAIRARQANMDDEDDVAESPPRLGGGKMEAMRRRQEEERSQRYSGGGKMEAIRRRQQQHEEEERAQQQLRLQQQQEEERAQQQLRQQQQHEEERAQQQLQQQQQQARAHQYVGGGGKMEAIRQRQEQSQYTGGKMAAIRRRQQEEEEEELVRKMNLTEAHEEPAPPLYRRGGKMEAIRQRQQEAESRPSGGGVGGEEPAPPQYRHGGKMEAIRQRQKEAESRPSGGGMGGEEPAPQQYRHGGKMEAIRQRQKEAESRPSGGGMGGEEPAPPQYRHGGKMEAIRQRQMEAESLPSGGGMGGKEPAPQYRHGGKMEAIRQRQQEAESRPSGGGIGGKLEAIRRRQETEDVATAGVWGGGKMEAIRRKQQSGDYDDSDDDLQSPMQEEVAPATLTKPPSPALTRHVVLDSRQNETSYQNQVEDKEAKADEEEEKEEDGDVDDEKDEDFEPVPAKKKGTKRREAKHSKKSQKDMVTGQPRKTAIEIEQEKLEEFERRKEEEARRKAEALDQEEEEVEPVGKRTKRTTRKTPTEKAKEESRAAARANLVARRNNLKVRGDDVQENEEGDRESKRQSEEAEAALQKTEEEELEAQLRKMPPKKAAAERKRMQKVKAERAAERERLRKLEQQKAAEAAADEETGRGEASWQREDSGPRLPNDDVSVFSSDTSEDDEDARQRLLQAEEEEEAEMGQPLTLDKLNSIRLPRHVLEEWALEPWLDEAVRGSFVRLGIGLYDGVQQYRICEVVRVDEYRHQYTFGKFYISKGLVLRIGRNERLWRMNLISNHRFSEIEFDVWKEDMAKDRARLPSVKEVERRKKLREEAVAKGRSMDKTEEMINAKLENAAKRIEVARYRDSGAPNVKGLNQGQWHTKLEWKLGSARDTYVEKLLAGAKNIPELAKRVSKIDNTDAAVRKLDDFDTELNDFAKDLEQAFVALGLPNEAPELRDARHEYNRARRALHDFEQNCIQTSRQRDLDAPYRAAELAAVNNRNKQENLRMDLEHASQANAAERDKEQSVYHRRSTKPTMLWSTNTASASAPTPAPVQGLLPTPTTAEPAQSITEPAPSTTEPEPSTIEPAQSTFEPAPSTIEPLPSAEVPVEKSVVESLTTSPVAEDGERQKEIDHILQLVLNAKPKPKQFVPPPPDQLPKRRVM